PDFVVGAANRVAAANLSLRRTCRCDGVVVATLRQVSLVGDSERRVDPKFHSTKWLTTTRMRARLLFNQLVEYRFRRPGGSMADQLSKVFAALSDPIRRDMVARLSAADATVSELAEPYEVSVQAVSKHLKVLEDSGLVSRTREAQRRPAHLEGDVFDLMTKWIERYQQQAEQRYQRLDAVLEQMDADEDEPRARRGAGDDHPRQRSRQLDDQARHPRG